MMGFMTNVSPSPGRRPRGIPTVLWWAVGAVTAAGILVVMIDVLTTQSSASFGWFAYQPLASAAVFARAGTFVTPTMWIGIALTVAGLLVLAYLLGRRSVKTPGTGTTPPE
jgi:heme/copper-type cytochrome/quinol oxidase subunit 1